MELVTFATRVCGLLGIKTIISKKREITLVWYISSLASHFLISDKCRWCFEPWLRRRRRYGPVRCRYISSVAFLIDLQCCASHINISRHIALEFGRPRWLSSFTWSQRKWIRYSISTAFRCVRRSITSLRSRSLERPGTCPIRKKTARRYLCFCCRTNVSTKVFHTVEQ